MFSSPKAHQYILGWSTLTKHKTRMKLIFDRKSKQDMVIPQEKKLGTHDPSLSKNIFYINKESLKGKILDDFCFKNTWFLSSKWDILDKE